jgi:NAD+ kinase
MPIDLVLVRHGQSEGNLAKYRFNHGDDSLFTPEFKARHNSQLRLTGVGRSQAEAAGKWLRDNKLDYFDRRYVSTYIRAMETAALLATDGADWMQEPMLREREWGEFETMSPEEQVVRSAESVATRHTDPFYWIPPNGESIAQVAVRLRSVLDTLHRECYDKRVAIVCHGEIMWAFRFILERMTVGQWTELDKDPTYKIYNCQIIHYTRRNPKTGVLSDRLDWVRSVNPQKTDAPGSEWRAISRKKFSNEELRAAVEAVKPLFPHDNGY